eukprot:scaffold142271_cov31-Tisochrysis_lutea.AAC.4
MRVAVIARGRNEPCRSVAIEDGNVDASFSTPISAGLSAPMRGEEERGRGGRRAETGEESGEDASGEERELESGEEEREGD